MKIALVKLTGDLHIAKFSGQFSLLVLLNLLVEFNSWSLIPPPRTTFFTCLPWHCAVLVFFLSLWQFLLSHLCRFLFYSPNLNRGVLQSSVRGPHFLRNLIQSYDFKYPLKLMILIFYLKPIHLSSLDSYIHLSIIHLYLDMALSLF